MIIHNPTEAPVRDYPIENPETRQVDLWSIMPGETLQFPDYVGSYLVQIYGFLQRVITNAERQMELDQQKKMSEGTHFSQIKILPESKEVENSNQVVETNMAPPLDIETDSN